MGRLNELFNDVRLINNKLVKNQRLNNLKSPTEFLKFSQKFFSPMAGAEQKESKIKELFTSQSEKIQSHIETYIRTTKDFPDEINALKALCTDQDYDRSLFVFYVELLSKAIKKPGDLSAFVTVVLQHIENVMSLKSSIIVLRTIRALCDCKGFVPVTFYLTKLMSVAMGLKNPKRTGKSIDYDRVKVSSEEAESEELQTFVIRECIVLIKKHCYGLGKSIGFPEVAAVLCNELKAQCRIGFYKEITMDLVKYISQRKSYIEEQRSKANLRSDDASAVSEFENRLEPWLNE